MKKMNRRNFGKLLLATTAGGMAALPSRRDAIAFQIPPVPTSRDFQSKIASLGKQLQENKALLQAKTKINRNTIIIESQKIKNVFPRIYGRTPSPADLTAFRNAASAFYGELDRSGMTAVIFQFLSTLPSDFRFGSTDFVREETNMNLKFFGVNMGSDIGKMASQADLQRERITRQMAGTVPQFSPMVAAGGAAGAVASGVCNLMDLVNNWDTLSTFQIAMDFLSLLLAGMAIMAAV